MKNTKNKRVKRLCLLAALVAVIGVSVIACGDGGGGGGDPLQLNGTYKAADGETVTLNNGSFEIAQDNKAFIKGTYTAAARSVSATISMTIKELHGDYLNVSLNEDNDDEPITLESKWYNKNQLIDALKKYMKDAGATDADITAVINSQSAAFNVMYGTITGTIDGDTMTLGSDTYTKQGGSTNPVNPGTGGTIPAITTSSLPDGVVGTAYSQTLSATGTAPITWSINTGALPAGLTLSPAGVISGTPTTAGEYIFSVKATNSAGSGTKSYFISITSGGTNPVTPGTDSMTWTQVTNSTLDTGTGGGVYAIVYANNKFVAGGTDGKMATSTDGVSWTAVADSKFGSSGINAIVYGNDKFVAVGNDSEIAYSSDGVTWTAVTGSYNLFSSGTSTINGVAWGNNKFVAVGYSNKIATSSDGITWTKGTISSFNAGNDAIWAIAFGGGKFVAVGNNGKMAYSSDGTSWTAVADSKFGTATINAIVYGGNKFVAVGDDGKIAYSSNGESWTLVTPAALILSGGAGEAIVSIAFGNNKFVAGGANGKMASSTDGGVTWKTVNIGTAFNVPGVVLMPGVHALAYGNGKFVGGGNRGILAYSSGN